MTKAKKSISIILSFLIIVSLFSIVPITSDAETYTSGDWEYELRENGAVALINYTGDSTDIIVPDEIDGYPVTSIGSTFYENNRINSVVIGNNVTTLYSDAFYNCQNLVSVTISDSVKTISNYAFDMCTSLENIYIPDSVKEIGSNVFEKTAYYKNEDNWEERALYIGHHLICVKSSDSSYSVKEGTKTIADYAFFNRSNLKEVFIPDGVISIGDYAFERCSILAKITIPDSVTRLSATAFNQTAYYNDDNNWEDGVLYIGHHLIRADKLLSGSYTIKNGTKTVADTAFGYQFNKPFSSCYHINEIIIPDSVVSIGNYAFNDCSIKSVIIGNSVSVIGENAFSNCSELKSVFIPDSVTDIDESAFIGCSDLESIEVDKNNPVFDSRENCNAIIKTASATLINGCRNSMIPEGIKAIADDAFYKTKINEIIIPDSVTKIGKSAFEKCDFLETAVISNNITTIENSLFYECSNLKYITIPDSVKTIENYAFEYCSSIRYITIGKGLNYIGSHAFYDCNSLTDIFYRGSEADWNSVEMYRGNNNLLEIDCFENCDKLNTIHYNYNYPFYYDLLDDNTAEITGLNCIISDLVIPEKVGEYTITSIGTDAFKDCDFLKSVIIPDSVERINSWAFFNCISLPSITIPENVNYIGPKAFGYFIEGFIIKGYKGTVAEEYANKNGFIFINLGTEETTSIKTVETNETTAPEADTLSTEPLETIPTSVRITKNTNPIKVSVKAKTVKLKKLKKKAQTVKTITVSKAQGKVTYKLIKKGSTAKLFKLAKINSKGVITIKKWKKAKKGTYKLNVKITAAGNANYKSKTVSKTVKIKVK